MFFLSRFATFTVFRLFCARYDLTAPMTSSALREPVSLPYGFETHLVGLCRIYVYVHAVYNRTQLFEGEGVVYIRIELYLFPLCYARPYEYEFGIGIFLFCNLCGIVHRGTCRRDIFLYLGNVLFRKLYV